MKRVPLLALLAAFVLAACAPRRAPQRPAPPNASPNYVPPLPPSATQTPPPAPLPVRQTPCFNSQYKFTCSIPPGYVITQEGEGPGEIMTLIPQSLSSSSTANLIVRASPLGKLNLDRFVAYRITGGLDGTEGMKHWDQFPATYGAYNGIEVAIEREYANGPFRSRIFVFTHGSTAFVLNYSASSDQFDHDQKVIETFLGSLTFAS